MDEKIIDEFVKKELKPALHLSCSNCNKYFDVDEQTLHWLAKHTIIVWIEKKRLTPDAEKDK